MTNLRLLLTCLHKRLYNVLRYLHFSTMALVLWRFYGALSPQPRPWWVILLQTLAQTQICHYSLLIY